MVGKALLGRGRRGTGADVGSVACCRVTGLAGGRQQAAPTAARRCPPPGRALGGPRALGRPAPFVALDRRRPGRATPAPDARCRWRCCCWDSRRWGWGQRRSATRGPARVCASRSRERASAPDRRLAAGGARGARAMISQAITSQRPASEELLAGGDQRQRVVIGRPRRPRAADDAERGCRTPTRRCAI